MKLNHKVTIKNIFSLWFVYVTLEINTVNLKKQAEHFAQIDHKLKGLLSGCGAPHILKLLPLMTTLKEKRVFYQ